MRRVGWLHSSPAMTMNSTRATLLDISAILM
jgi:hypothetical protein